MEDNDQTDASYTGDNYNEDVNSPEFKDGKNERKAIKNASQALRIARRLEYQDYKRDFERARVLAAFNGNAPYDESEMANAAQSYRFNVSFGFMEGVIGRATVPYQDLVNDDEHIANVDGDLEGEKLIIMRDEFSEILKQWGRWEKLTSRQIQDMVLYGYNTMIWPSDYDPFPLFIPQKESFVHEMTMNEVGDLELFVWKKSYLIHELYAKIEDKKSAEKAGWNIKNVYRALEDATPKDIYQRAQSGMWTALEEAIRGGTLFSSMVGGKQITAYHVLASELNGEVTHYVVWDGGADNRNDDGTPYAELFKRERRWPSFEDMLVYFDMEPGDGKWHGSRGLGRRAFNTHRSIDKLRCSVLDQAFVSGLTLLQPSDSSSNEDFQLAVTGPFAVIPPGITISATSLPAISATTFQVDSLLAATAEQRIGDVVPSTQNPLTGGEKTATQSNIDASRQQLISKSNLTRYLNPISKVCSIILKRLLKENSPDEYAKRFQKDLTDRGFDKEDFKKVRGARSTGKIDSIIGTDKANMDMLLAAYKGDPDVDQVELKRRQMAATVGTKEVKGLLIEGPDKTKEIEAVREQKEEISTMLDGIALDVSPRDFHEVHAAVAIEWLKGQLQQQAQGQPGASLQIVDGVAQHVKQHIQFLHADKTKKQLVQALDEEMRKIGHGFDQLEKMAQQHMQEQQQLQAQGGNQQINQGQAAPSPAPAPKEEKGVSQSLSFKDLPPSGKIQMAARAGIILTPEDILTQENADTAHQIAMKSASAPKPQTQSVP